MIYFNNHMLHQSLQFTVGKHHLKKSISTHVCPKPLKEGQELSKAPGLSHSFKITHLDLKSFPETL